MKIFNKCLSVALTIVLLCSIIPYSVNAVTNPKYVNLGGDCFGMKFYSNGVMVIKLEDYYNGQTYCCPSENAGIKVNDVITKANNKKICSNEELKNVIDNCKNKFVNLVICRNNKNISLKIQPIKNTAGQYLIGAWVRDSCAGIGTVTYYDTSNKYFAALGHGICDTDTLKLMPLNTGEAVKANICSINKSCCGKAGSLNGYFTDEKVGILTKNSDLGIYGTINDNNFSNRKILKTGSFNDIKVGKAKMYTTINSQSVKCYNIEIEKICNNNAQSNENFVIKVTDNELLKNCGGIVQGMSGSPIVQNNILVGAVTHMFVNQPNEGYGIITQNMVENYNN